MRVLIVCHHAPPHIGGLENLVDLEVRALARRGHEVVVVTSNLGGAGAQPDYPDNVRVVRVGAWHVFERRFALAYPIFSPRLAWVLWRELGRCDVMHAHGFVFMSTAVAMPLAALRRRPRILTDHGGLLRYPSRRMTWGLRLLIETVGRLDCRLATKLVAYNAHVQRLLERLSGRPGKVVFLPNPVDRERFHPPTPDQRAATRRELGWSDDRPRVLFVGRLVPDKGLDILLDAKDPSFDLVFCGPGEPAVIARLKERGAQHLPPRPQRDLIRVYHAADVFALPSWNEGFPVAIQEALACGLPVVTTQTDAYEPYRPLPNLHLSPIDPPTFRQAILDVLRSPSAGRGESPGEPGKSGGPAGAADALLPDVDQWLSRLFDAPPSTH
jgi:glycosyltransferase involved in cell wall biosynthesis